MAEMADATAQFLAQKFPDLSEQEILDKATTHVKIEFPHRFEDEEDEKQSIRCRY